MALLKCHDCEGPVSDAAAACPRCGRPVEVPAAKERPTPSKPYSSREDDRPTCSTCGYRAADFSGLDAHIKAVHSGMTLGSARPVQSAPTARPTASTKRQKISQVGDDSTGTLQCPKCGGGQFKTRRSGLHRTAMITTVGVAGLLKSGSQVRCTTCGTIYKRG